MVGQPHRKKLEIFKYVLYISFPVAFGYGLGRMPAFWQRVEELFPTAAHNPKGPYLPIEATAHRPSLHTEYQKLVLEEALDAALAEARRNKAQKQQQEQPAAPA